VSCNEVHNPSNHLPANFLAGATTQGGYDTVTCNIAAPSFLAGQTITIDWFSDFGIQFDQNVGVIQTQVSGGGSPTTVSPGTRAAELPRRNPEHFGVTRSSYRLRQPEHVPQQRDAQCGQLAALVMEPA